MIGADLGRSYAYQTPDMTNPEDRLRTIASGINPKLTPVIVGDNIYYMNNMGYLESVDMKSGQTQWSYPVSGDVSNTSPVVAGDLIVINSDKSLTVLNRLNGNEIFTRQPLFSPIVAHEKILGVKGDEILAIDPLTGEELWSYKGPSRGYLNLAVFYPISVGDDRVFAYVYPHEVHAIDINTGLVLQYLRQLSSERVSRERVDTPKPRNLCQKPLQ